jgi:exosome complex component RRP4
MEKLLKKDGDFIVPGEEIVSSMNYLPGKNCFREGNSIYAKKLGFVSINNKVISVIHLSCVYIPRIGDMVIAEIEDIQSSGWVVNINSAYDAYLPLSGIKDFIDTSKTDLSSIYKIGDMIYAKISSVSLEADLVSISMQDVMARKLIGGRIVYINPAKIPRVIGKNGSMINLIKQKTGCKINVGQNGMIWLDGEKKELAIDALKMIEKESHTNGLTDKISKFLEKGIFR